MSQLSSTPPPASSAAAPVILIIDDEAPIRRLLRVSLESANFVVTEAENGQKGLTEAAYHQPSAVVLDLGLPDLDGKEVVRRLRGWSHTPVLILSVRDREEEKIAALDAGADDYLTKPFGPGELVARLRALLRRVTPGNEPPVMVFGDVEVDLAARVVHRGGGIVHLTAKEYALLHILLRHRGKVITHRHILRELWGPNSEDQTHYLRVFMAHLRKKLEPDPQQPRYLKTEPGIGYRFVEAE